MSATLNHAAPYQQTVNVVISSLGADAQRGLSKSEANKRLEQYGRNKLAKNIVWITPPANPQPACLAATPIGAGRSGSL
jgi:magnesium-transporting ATPase (P-type)